MTRLDTKQASLHKRSSRFTRLKGGYSRLGTCLSSTDGAHGVEFDRSLQTLLCIRPGCQRCFAPSPAEDMSQGSMVQSESYAVLPFHRPILTSYPYRGFLQPDGRSLIESIAIITIDGLLRVQQDAWLAAITLQPSSISSPPVSIFMTT